MRRLLVVNGPNLNLLGTRAPDVYGSTALAELEEACRQWGMEVGVEVSCYQSNHEGEIIDRIHAARQEVDGIVLNPGALTHYSYALHDAIEAVGLPTVEVHISNIEEREEWRRVSVVRSACVHTIYGRGVAGYRWAIRHLVHRTEMPFETVSYGDHPDQRIDLRRPGSTPAGLALVLHGGFWRHEWTRDVTEGIAIDLTRRGLITANAEYRRTGKGGGWPQTLDDVVAAAASLAELRDGVPLVLVGHSAGGQLALLAAEALGEQRVVTIAPITDLVAAVREGLGGAAALAFLAGSPPEPASPLHRLPVGFRPALLHGEEDGEVPVRYSKVYAERSGAELVVVESAGHFRFLERSSEAWQQTAEVVEAALS